MSIRGVFTAVQRVEAALIAGSILGIAALTVFNVFTRTVLDFSVASAEEISQFLMLIVTFVGLSYAASQGRHIRMTALYDQLPHRSRKIVMTTITATTSLLMAALTVFAVQYAATVHALGTVSPALQLPLWMVYAVAPVGLGLTAIQYALTTIRNLMEPDVFISFDVRDVYEDPVQPGI